MAEAAGTLARPMRRRDLGEIAGRRFYQIMALVAAAVIVYGFSQTVDANLIHPAKPRPAILYFHAPVFVAWLLLFLTQTSLIQAGRVNWHMRLGVAGAALGFTMIPLGIATAIAMDRFHGDSDSFSFFAIQTGDMLNFGCVLTAALLMRGRPEFHRRLMLVATVLLTDAGFGRFPGWIVPQLWFPAFAYLAVDLLIGIAIARDLLVMKRVHPVYLWALPLVICAQTIETLLYRTHSAQWMALVHKIIGV